MNLFNVRYFDLIFFVKKNKQKNGNTYMNLKKKISMGDWFDF